MPQIGGKQKMAELNSTPQSVCPPHHPQWGAGKIT